MKQGTKFKVKGSVTPGFESVKSLFEHNMQTLSEEHAQLCVYHRGEKVIDLWASTTDESNFTADSLVTVFSSGKSLESIAMASLMDKGLLSFDDKVTDYWPEFGVKGKAELTISELMRHEAGLANFDTSLHTEDLLKENIKQNKVGQIIEQQTQRFPKIDGVKREYHAMTRGWIVNEIFRRVDPAGRTIGEFLREDISEPLGADAVIGLKEEELGRVTKVTPLSTGFQLLQSLKPKILGRKIVHNIIQLLTIFITMIPSMLKGTMLSGTPPFKDVSPKDGLGVLNLPSIAMGETSSVAANCSARGLAKIGAVIVGGGTFGGIKYLSEQACKAIHLHPVEAAMGGFLPTKFTQSGVTLYTKCNQSSSKIERALNQGREGFYGWMGLGGSIFQWHTKLNISFAFVPTSLHSLDFLNERGKVYQAEVLKCVEKIGATD